MNGKFKARPSVNLGDASGCGSCNARLKEKKIKTPMKLWQEMKQNCFLSPPACKPTQTYPQKKKKKKKYKETQNWLAQN